MSRAGPAGREPGVDAGGTTLTLRRAELEHGDDLAARRLRQRDDARCRRYSGGATRRSMSSPTRACHGRSTICHISAWTWWRKTMRGHRAHNGEKNGMPFQISTRPSGRPRHQRHREPTTRPSARPALAEAAQGAAGEDAVAPALAHHVVPVALEPGPDARRRRGPHGDVDPGAGPQRRHVMGVALRSRRPRGRRGPARRASGPGATRRRRRAPRTSSRVGVDDCRVMTITPVTLVTEASTTHCRQGPAPTLRRCTATKHTVMTTHNPTCTARSARAVARYWPSAAAGGARQGAGPEGQDHAPPTATRCPSR